VTLSKVAAVVGVAAMVLVAAPVSAQEPQAAIAPAGFAFRDLLPADDLSPTVLGIYRKLMEIESEIRRQTDRYGLDYDLARAVCMYESGGNANLTSWAGARGYFQVMPATFRTLGVKSNIEAGIKYLAQLVRRFEREDYALAAYNGGPTNVGRGRAMRLESLQYVLGVGTYRTLLKLYEPSLRHHASELLLTQVAEGENWWTVSRRLDMPLLTLRLYNPYLARRELRPGQLVAYPPAPRDDLFAHDGTQLWYRTRLGDNYFNLAFVLDVDLDQLRQDNELWHLQTLPVGMLLRIPLQWEGEHTIHRVQTGETIDQIAEAMESDPWRIIRDNGLFWDESVKDGMLLRVRRVPPRPRFVTHRVARGENLTMIARRYGTSVAVIQRNNNRGRRTLIRVGERLQIPTVAE